MMKEAYESHAPYRRVATKGVEAWKRSTEIQTRPEPATATPRRQQDLPQQVSPETGDVSTLKPLRKMAIKWMNAELDFYRGSKDRSEYSPWMNDDNEEGCAPPPRDPSVDHLAAAASEFSRRFPFRSLEDEEEQHSKDAIESSWSERPFLLVSNRVRDDWEVPDEFVNLHSVRFMLVPGDTVDCSILFIKCMAGPKHGRFDGWITNDIEDWISSNRLRSILNRIGAGGVGYEPDEAYAPAPTSGDRNKPEIDADERLDGDPFARLVLEVEYAHRDVKIVRELGFSVLSNPYTRLFLAVRIWPKNKDGNFGAAAVLWDKDDNGIISVRKAVDFGTRELHAFAKRGFEVLPGNSMLPMLPPVRAWTRPEPSLGYEKLRDELDALDVAAVGDRPQQANHNWLLVLPKADLLYRISSSASTEARPYALSLPAVQAMDDCRIDLRWFAANVNRLDF